MADNFPCVLYANGDGIGPEIVASTIKVIDTAVKKVYGGRRAIRWEQIQIGETALEKFGALVPAITLKRGREVGLILKGPLETPTGGGYRSPSVALRVALDLYANVRPVRYVKGVDSPLKRPEDVDLVIFRENTDDIYTGIEWPYKSKEAALLRRFVAKKLKASIESDAGIGIKEISKFKTERVTRMAIEYAIKNKRRSVTIMHKGNIMKFTEGAFVHWAYALAIRKFRKAVVTEQEVLTKHKGVMPKGKILINDRIADNMFQQIITKPENYDIILAPNLNGDYISDAAGALIGNIGILGSANIGDHAAMFEAIHGTAPKYAGKNVANPTGMINGGCLMLDHMGWGEASKKIREAIGKAIESRKVTQDIARLSGVKALGTKEYTDVLIGNIQK